MVMLCLQTSCHRCPSALHNRLVTSTPSLSPLSLIHHVRFDASSGPLAAKALPRARSREPRPSREKRWRGHWPGRGGGIPVEEKRVVDHGDSGARGDGVLARSRAGPSRRAKAATAPGPGIIIEFLPTGPHQTARGDAPDTTERHKD